MATIVPYTDNDGKIVSYQIQVYRGRDKNGKKLKPYVMSWKVPSTFKSEKAIQKALDKVVGEFETECKRGERSIDKRTFQQYSEYVMTLKERDNKSKTVHRYYDLLEVINEEIGDIRLTDLSGEDLNKLYIELGKEKKTYKEMATAGIDFKQLLSDRKMTQKRFCQCANIGSKSLTALLRGQNIKIETANKIADYLQMSFSDLFLIVRKEHVRKLSPRTIGHHHKLIHTILAQAKKERHIIFNPADEATPPKIPKREAQFFEVEEIIAINTALKEQPAHWQAIVMLLIDTGARRGEIMGLKWKFVNFENQTINIENNLQYVPGKGIYDETTKTEDIRTVSISPEIMDFLHAFYQEQENYKKMVGSYWHETGYCFTGWDGMPFHPNSLNNWLDEFSEKNSLPKINPHKFRHSQASILYANNVDPITISKRLGHSDVSTTQNIYAHIMNKSDRKAQEAIANALYRK